MNLHRPARAAAIAIVLIIVMVWLFIQNGYILHTVTTYQAEMDTQPTGFIQE